jgi:hypothetical protein
MCPQRCAVVEVPKTVQRHCAFHFQTIFEAGGTVGEITARFPAGTTPETIGGVPNIAVNEATIEPSNGALVTSNPVTVTPRVNAESDWTVSKIRTIPAGVLPAVGQNVTYRIRVKQQRYGGIGLKRHCVTTHTENASCFRFGRGNQARVLLPGT